MMLTLCCLCMPQAGESVAGVPASTIGPVMQYPPAMSKHQALPPWHNPGSIQIWAELTGAGTVALIGLNISARGLGDGLAAAGCSCAAGGVSGLRVPTGVLVVSGVAGPPAAGLCS